MPARRKDPAGETASEQVRLRLSPRRKRFLARAAAVAGEPVTELALRGALLEAGRVLEEDPAPYLAREAREGARRDRGSAAS